MVGGFFGHKWGLAGYLQPGFDQAFDIVEAVVHIVKGVWVPAFAGTAVFLGYDVLVLKCVAFWHATALQCHFAPHVFQTIHSV